MGVKISLIDIGGVYLLPLLFGFNLYTARILSLSAALLVGYFLNRYFTFGGVRRGCFYRQMAGHFSVHLCGGAINFGIYSLIIHVGHEHLSKGPVLHFLPIFALWMGGVIGLCFNFFVSKNLVFRPHRTGETETSGDSSLFAATPSENKG